MRPPELTGLLSQLQSAPLEDFQQILIKVSYWKREKKENGVGCKLNPPPPVCGKGSRGSANLFLGDLEKRAALKLLTRQSCWD